MPTNRTTRRSASRPTANGSSPFEKPQAPSPDPQSRYAPNVWLNGDQGALEEVEVPSGQRCLMRRPGAAGLMKAGVLHNVDSLSALVGEKYVNKSLVDPDKNEVDVEGFLEDPVAVEKVMHTIDRTVCYCVVQPPVLMAPNDVTQRKPDQVYTDMIDLVDKMYLFTWVIGGVEDLASFRRAASSALGGVEPGEDVPDAAQ